jgi:hypothetical protein
MFWVSICNMEGVKSLSLKKAKYFLFFLSAYDIIL